MATYKTSKSSSKESISSSIKKSFLIVLGWFFVVLAIIGAFLPLLPTTPFLILALSIFAKCSPRFHKMLLDNKYFGNTLKVWEQNRTVSRTVKKRATLLIVFSFGASILILQGRDGLQIMLLCLASILLFFIWHLKEK